MLIPAKAQKPVKVDPQDTFTYEVQNDVKGYFVLGTGMAGNINTSPMPYYGINYILKTGKNNLDIFAGGEINKQGQADFLALIINNYKWTQNISSWVRGVLSASHRLCTTSLQVAPIKGNVDVGKFNFAAAPAYVVNHNFTSNQTTQSANAIIQTTYNATDKDQVLVEYNIPITSKSGHLIYAHLDEKILKTKHHP